MVRAHDRTRGVRTRSHTRCTHTVRAQRRAGGHARGAITRSRTWCAHAHGRARVKKNTRSFNIKDFFFVNQICHLPYPSLFALMDLKIEISQD